MGRPRNAISAMRVRVGVYLVKKYGPKIKNKKSDMVRRILAGPSPSTGVLTKRVFDKMKAQFPSQFSPRAVLST